MLPRPAVSGAPVALTEKLLITAGGWEAIRHARGLREAGRVSGAAWSPPVLQGMVREGDREYRAGLKILGPTNVENLCTCRPSREYGTICAHSLAVGLAIIAGQSPAPLPAAAKAQTPASRPAVALPYQADPAATARLHVVLAPDVAAAWGKNQLLVGLEIVAAGQRGMFGAGGGRTLRPEDFRVVERLAAVTKVVPGGMSFVDRAGFVELLDALAGHPRLTLGRAAPLAVDATPLLPPLSARFLDDDSLEIRAQLPEGSRVLAAAGRAWLLRAEKTGTTLQPVSPGLPAPYLPLLEEPSRRLPRDQAAAFLDAEWPRLEPFFDLRSPSISPASSVVADPEPAPPQFALSLEGSLNQLGVELRAVYPDNRIQHASAEPERRAVAFAKNAPAHLVRTRNVTAERAAVARLKDWGFAGPNNLNQYFLRGEDAVLRFFAGVLPALQREEPGWRVTLGARFSNVARQIEIITPEFSVARSGEDWFEMELSLTGSSGERYSSAEIQRLLQMGSGHARLRNGKRAILPEAMLNDFQEVLRDCDPSQPRPGVYRLDQSRGAYLESTLERWNVAAAPSWQQYVERQGGFRRAAEMEPPAGLGETMRPYQQEGFRWLHLLAANNLGGILADEMGLGKTIQALAYLASDRPGSEHQPSLVVCPTSLVDNWRREAAKFTPGLRTLPIDGPDRAPLFARIATADLVITSYALLRRDLDKYRAYRFATVILDEAHHIKNPDSQVAQAACALHSDHRFVLTGTPMENSVRDLWSIMHFALPGYLGSRQDFRERYEQPLGRGDADPAVRDRLTRRLRPVLLRRRKKDVAAELPARIEQTAFCDLTPAQADVYRRLLEQSRLKLDTARRDKNQGAGRMLVLTALLRLRQACCDLRLLGLPEHPAAAAGGDAVDADAVPASSAKLALLDELLEEVREGGHRVLIFSQFVSMLKLLSTHLESAKTPFCYLDGSTKVRDRATQVERFQTDESVTAFLISVKAGGVGLNLTGADTVIHFDPWWNPAVEAQATDRAHRIGQTRVVTAYRLIARGTVEEKIFALQNRKKELAASLVEREADEPMLETLSFDEIESLLE